MDWIRKMRCAVFWKLQHKEKHERLSQPLACHFGLVLQIKMDPSNIETNYLHLL